MGNKSRMFVFFVIFFSLILLVFFAVRFLSSSGSGRSGENKLSDREIVDHSSDDYTTSENIHVVFFNPGAVEDIGVWGLVSKFMMATADDLNINLEILYAERDHLLMVEQVEEVVLRTQPPDYAIIVNEKLMAERMLLSLQKIQTETVVIHNDITLDQRKKIGNEREKISNWIGSIVTDEYQAGYKEISQLYLLMDKEPKVVGITGDVSTPVSKIRENGLRDYIDRAGRGELYQVLNGNWSFEDGKEKANGLLERYNDINIIWTANDSMGLGAYSAVVEKGLENEIVVGGLGGFPDSLKSIQNNGLKLTVGGHMMIGAWALIMIFDYEQNLDFINDIGLSYKVDHLFTIDSSDKVGQFRDLVLNHPEKIDFTRFSKYLNHSLQNYDFSFMKVVSASMD